ncbi:MAG: Fur family ferric uptake transcriptional regulator [Myxococcota bacterium]
MSVQTPKKWEERLDAYLQANGLRATRQRRLIAEMFFEHEGHPNIDELYETIRNQDASIGQATVYRTLKLLVESGLAHESRFGDGTTRYEGAGGDHHDHLICLDCSKIVEFRNDTIEQLQDDIALEHGFKVADHKMVIYANCTRVRCPDRVGGRDHPGAA